MAKLTVSMPHWRTPSDLLRRAVHSVLDQTFTDLRLIVVNDGESPEKVWEPLSDIDDPRLIRFDLDTNRGRYYADAVTLKACDTVWWTPHDADDWSEPHRFETLMQALGDKPAVFSPSIIFTRDGREVLSKVRPDRLVPPAIGTIAKYPAGIYRTQVAKAVGGPHPELRGSYDTTFVSLVWYAFKPVVVEEPLYHVYKRKGSLTTSKATHLKSDWRKQQRKRRKALYRKAISEPVRRWPNVLRPSEAVAKALDADSRRLKAILQDA